MQARRITRVLIPIACCVPLMALAGCSGSNSHTIAAGTTGSLMGIDFTPPDHTLKVDTDTTCRLYWHTGYTPPAQFTASLKTVSPESKKESVRTEMKQVGSAYAWDLEPVGNLEPETIYFIEVSAATEFEISMFLTEPGTSKNRGRAGETKDPTGRGAFEHKVVPTRDTRTD